MKKDLEKSFFALKTPLSSSIYCKISLFRKNHWRMPATCWRH